ncbi:hypothetical protein DPMN_079722 [Dreissena polymorpha]|uniref:Uncharacterized protein n=1 Tax=Dreissena polymorpha TaxID=45954 RepID=A0A9D3YSN9_DREPO|nr:hypothetical protein DPMN_079722 [Dreissena polymorpha]
MALQLRIGHLAETLSTYILISMHNSLAGAASLHLESYTPHPKALSVQWQYQGFGVSLIPNISYRERVRNHSLSRQAYQRG